MRTTSILAVLMLTVLAAPAAARQETMTLKGLFALTPADAASQVLGRDAARFVERSPWNGIEPNYVLNTFRLFGMSFFARPERIGPGVCGVQKAMITFDTLPDAKNDAQAFQAASLVPYGDRPLRRLGPIYSQQVFFVAGPASPTPLTADQPPMALGPEALEADSCANPVASRRTFSAPDAEAAVEAVRVLNAIVKAAANRRSLPFTLSADCGGDCPDPRAVLAALDAKKLFQVDASACPAGKSAPPRCFKLNIYSDKLDGYGDEYITLTLAVQPTGKPKGQVKMSVVHLPIF